MSRLLLSGFAFAFALGSSATIGHALVPSHTLDGVAFPAILVADEEVEAVEQALEPEEVTPVPKGDMSEGGADVEQKELKMEEPAMDLPPDE